MSNPVWNTLAGIPERFECNTEIYTVHDCQLIARHLRHTLQIDQWFLAVWLGAVLMLGFLAMRIWHSSRSRKRDRARIAVAGRPAAAITVPIALRRAPARAIVAAPLGRAG